MPTTAYPSDYPAVFDAFRAEVEAEVSGLDVRTRHLVRLAATIAADATTAYAGVLGAALDDELTPAEASEVLVQAVPYVGKARVDGFAEVLGGVLADHGLDLPPVARPASLDQADAGIAVQREIVGSATVDTLYAEAPADQRHIQRWLSSHCFGDHYTRTSVLDLPTRELLTLVLLAALGGADAQVAGHVAGNLNVGNDRATMTAAITLVLPWIGYPRTLNALSAIDSGTDHQKES